MAANLDGPDAGSTAVPAGAAKLSDVVYAKIAGGIASGEYPVGRKLPTENDLAEQFSVSRPVVREALSRLRDDGIVVSRRGSGTYVRRAPMAADRRLGPLSSIADMRRCLEFRISFEGESAYRAAEALTDAGLARIDDALARLQQELEAGEITIESDFAFHFAISQATENRFFSATMSAMQDPITVGMAITRNFALLRTQERLEELHREHQAIRDAVARRNAPEAQAAMREHLTKAMARAFEGTL